MPYPLSDDAAAAVDGWPAAAQTLLNELFEDAGSDLQREFLSRAIAARRSPAEVHAFADELRALTDEQAYAACTVDRSTALNQPFEQLLKAEADPLFAFELMGGVIEPNHSIPPKPPMPVSIRGSPSEAFDAGPRQPRASLKGFAQPSQLGSILAGETRGLGLTWKEYELDVPQGLAMREALAAAADALRRGLPVPAFIGSRAGEHARIIVLMQLQASGASRAWQLYDPLSAELVWTHEGNLLAKDELPLANKANRQLTRIAIPRRKG